MAIVIPKDNLSDSSLETNHCIKVVKLTGKNWNQWQMRFANILTSKGYKDLLDEEWTKANHGTSTFKCRNAWALNQLFSTTSRDLHHNIEANKGSFIDAYNALCNACGNASILTIVTKLQQLTKMEYTPGTLLQDHINRFSSLYTSLKS